MCVRVRARVRVRAEGRAGSPSKMPSFAVLFGPGYGMASTAAKCRYEDGSSSSAPGTTMGPGL